MSWRASTAFAVPAGLILLTAGLGSSPRLDAQTPQSRPADQFIAKLLPSRYALSVRSGQLSGAGAQVLAAAIAESRFVLLGEYHGLAQTPEFWAAVCKVAGAEGFHTMAVEEGPLAAAELENLVQRPDPLSLLVAFQKKFPGSLNVSSAREEFDMLQQCARAGQSEFRGIGLQHAANPGANLGGLVYTGVNGALLALLVLRTRSLWIAIGYHASWNLTASILLGLRDAGNVDAGALTRTRLQGPRLLTGGSYGFEASILAGVIELAVLLLLLWHTPSVERRTIAREAYPSSAAPDSLGRASPSAR